MSIGFLKKFLLNKYMDGLDLERGTAKNEMGEHTKKGALELQTTLSKIDDNQDIEPGKLVKKLTQKKRIFHVPIWLPKYAKCNCTLPPRKFIVSDF